MAKSVDHFKGGNSEGMDISGDELSETGFLEEGASVDSLDQSMDSLKDSVPMFHVDQSNPLQRSQGFNFSGFPTQNTGMTPSFGFSEGSSLGIGVTPGQSNIFLQGVDNMTKDVKPVFISSEIDLANFTQCVGGSSDKTLENRSHINQNQAAFNTGAFLMSIQNSNPGIVTFGQTANNTDAFKSDNVFTFGSESATSQVKPGSSTTIMDSSGEGFHGDGKGPRSKHSTKHRQRKSRSQSASSDMKVEPQVSCSPNQLETPDLQGSADLGFKPSLLDEILSEKKMALMRSAEVVQFLQAQQKKITHGQYTES